MAFAMVWPKQRLGSENFTNRDFSPCVVVARAVYFEDLFPRTLPEPSMSAKNVGKCTIVYRMEMNSKLNPTIAGVGVEERLEVVI